MASLDLSKRRQGVYRRAQNKVAREINRSEKVRRLDEKEIGKEPKNSKKAKEEHHHHTAEVSEETLTHAEKEIAMRHRQEGKQAARKFQKLINTAKRQMHNNAFKIERAIQHSASRRDELARISAENPGDKTAAEHEEKQVNEASMVKPTITHTGKGLWKDYDEKTKRLTNDIKSALDEREHRIESIHHPIRHAEQSAAEEKQVKEAGNLTGNGLNHKKIADAIKVSAAERRHRLNEIRGAEIRARTEAHFSIKGQRAVTLQP